MIAVHRTSQAVPTERPTALPPLAFAPEPADVPASVLVDDGHRFETIEGFGGAFTESAAVTFYKLSPEHQRQLRRDHFDPEVGNGYTLGRTHIDSCGFSLGNRAYGETDGDPEWKDFSVARDREAIIPFLQAAAAAAAWCDWNLLLDETGGPNHVGNFCSAPIMVDTRVPGGQIVRQSLTEAPARSITTYRWQKG